MVALPSPLSRTIVSCTSTVRLVALGYAPDVPWPADAVVTALLSACGITVATCLVAALLSLPRQLVQVVISYFGELKAESGTRRSVPYSSPQHLTTHPQSLMPLTNFLQCGLPRHPVFALKYIIKLQQEVKGTVIYECRKQRQIAAGFRLAQVVWLADKTADDHGVRAWTGVTANQLRYWI
jgi:hypothetical protein